MAIEDNFFETPKEQSIIKSEIVAKYFAAWANVMVGTSKKYPDAVKSLAYIDVFCGQGRYDDEKETDSTPLKVLKHSIDNPQLSSMLITIFNDFDKEAIKKLEDAINKIPHINSLTYPPSILQRTC